MAIVPLRASSTTWAFLMIGTLETYTELHRDMGRSLVMPTCVILLDGDADLAFSRISERGRGCEVGMSKTTGRQSKTQRSSRP